MYRETNYEPFFKFSIKSLRLRNTGLASSRAKVTSWGEGISLTLVSHPSANVATIKLPFAVDVLLHWPALHPLFSIGFVKTESQSLDQLRST